MMESQIEITIKGDSIRGNLSVPDRVEGIVLFAHGSGSSRHSARNNFVAEKLRDGQLATLLIDLLTLEEKEIDRQTRELRFDIDRLQERVIGTVDWLSDSAETQDLAPGVFGSSTGAAGALIAAAVRPKTVQAVVSRGGRVDLAESRLPEVEAPTLFIVGGKDTRVLELNRSAFQKLKSPKNLEVVSGAGHLFEEPGALDEVARLTLSWFQKYLQP